MTGNLIKQQINSKLSRLTIRAFAGGVLSAFGHNPTIVTRDLKGEVSYVPDKPEEAKVRLEINAASLEVTDNISEKDRKDIERSMREEVLEINKYPKIVFDSTSIAGEKLFEGQYHISITGNLVLHGTSKSKVIQGHVIIQPDSLRVYGEFPLLQSEYGIKRVSVLSGSLQVKDELKLSFDIIAS